MREQLEAAKEDFDNAQTSKNRKKDPNKGLHSEKIELMNTRLNTERELTSEESEALEKFRTKDKEIDDMLILVIQDMDLLKEKAIHIDAAIDRNQKKLDKTEKHAAKTKQKMENINLKLKGIIQKYAEPSRMCIYIILLLVALGLVTIIYTQYEGFSR